MTGKTFEKDDKIGLTDFAEFIEQDIQANSHKFKDQSYTISLNSGYGYGKTWFLEMWSDRLKKKSKDKYEVVFIDAWKTDYCKTPIVALISSFLKSLNKEEDVATSIYEAIKDVGNQIVQNRIGVNIQQVGDKARGGLKTDFLKEFWETEENLDKLKEELTKLRSKLNKDVIILVDELDRSRPDYAVEFLESVKHLFDIEGLIFIFSVNREQMKSTVESLYGKSINFDGYYRKFFIKQIDLPSIKGKLEKFFKENTKEFKIAEENKVKDGKSVFLENALHLIECYNFTLRELEHFFSELRSIFSKDRNKKNCQFLDSDRCYLDTLFFLLVMKWKNKPLYNQMKNKSFSVSELYDDERDIPKIKKRLIENSVLKDKYRLMASLLRCLICDENEGFIQQFTRYFFSGERESKSITSAQTIGYESLMGIGKQLIDDFSDGIAVDFIGTKDTRSHAIRKERRVDALFSLIEKK